MTTTIEQTIDDIRTKLESIPTGGDFIADATFVVGKSAEQGDLVFVRIADLPASVKTRTDRQLAEGDTQGSRHVVEGGDVYNADAKDVVAAIKKANGADVDAKYIGPVFVGPCTVTHPEHGHHTYTEGMVLATVFQRSQDAEEREARVRD